MKTLTINYKGEKFEIISINAIYAIDEDYLHEGLSNNHFEEASEINAFVEGCDAINPYYTKQTAEEEFDSFKNLDNSHVIDEENIEISRTQDELGRKKWVLDQIIYDSTMSLEDELIELQEMPENFINSIYEISRDEMSDIEASESIEWIKQELTSNM